MQVTVHTSGQSPMKVIVIVARLIFRWSVFKGYENVQTHPRLHLRLAEGVEEGLGSDLLTV